MTDDQLPPPPVPADCDLRTLDGFMLNVERLLASELWALATPDEFKAAMALWCRAWKQIPAASLPNDERTLAAFAGIAPNRWPKVRGMALRGFYLCSDGRLYHRTLAEDAARVSPKHEHFKARAKAAAEARWRRFVGADSTKQACNDDATSNACGNASSIARGMLAHAQGQEQGQCHIKSIESTPPPPPVSVRANPDGTQEDTATATAANVMTNDGKANPGESRQDQAATVPGEGSCGRSGQEQANPRQRSTPKRVPTGPDASQVRNAVHAGDLHALISLWGAGSAVEWARDFPGVSLAQIATLLAWKTAKREPIRHASGGRAAQAEFAAMDGKERREWALYAVNRYGLPVPDFVRQAAAPVGAA